MTTTVTNPDTGESAAIPDDEVAAAKRDGWVVVAHTE